MMVKKSFLGGVAATFPRTLVELFTPTEQPANRSEERVRVPVHEIWLMRWLWPLTKLRRPRKASHTIEPQRSAGAILSEPGQVHLFPLRHEYSGPSMYSIFDTCPENRNLPAKG